MSVRVSTYGGKIGWLARKYLPFFSSTCYLRLQYAIRRKTSYKYITNFMKSEEVPKPLNILIETVNRCNGECAFCTANRHYDKRVFYKMPNDVFRSLVDQLSEWEYAGYISLFANNEPFMDTEIISKHEYLRKKLPNATIKLFTNGLLLNVDMFKQIAPYVDLFVINNYCENMQMHKNIDELYRYLIQHPQIHSKLNVQIKIRYAKEVLTNRAGTAPNKKNVKVIKEPCLFPYTDMVIFSNGNVGLCCCDVTEITRLGNIQEDNVKDIWNNSQYKSVREIMQCGRHNNAYCKECDFVDAGLRTRIIRGKRNG